MRMKDYSAGMWCTECPTLLKEASIGRQIYLQCSQQAADPCSTEAFTVKTLDTFKHMLNNDQELIK